MNGDIENFENIIKILSQINKTSLKSKIYYKIVSSLWAYLLCYNLFCIDLVLFFKLKYCILTP